MATDFFLKVEGIKGESKDHKHKDEIEVLAWSWGATQSGSFHRGVGGGAGKSSFQDMNITKYLDSASPLLLKACSIGQHVKSAVLTLRKAGGDDPVEYAKMTMTNCLVTNVSLGGSGGEEHLTENLTINFEQFKLEYAPQDDKGGMKGVIPFEFSISENKAK